MTQRIGCIGPLSFHFLEGIIVAVKDIRSVSPIIQASHFDVLGSVVLCDILLGKLRL